MFLSVAERRQIRALMAKYRLEARHIMPEFRKMCERNQRVYGSPTAGYSLCEISHEMRVVEVIAFIQKLIAEKTQAAA